MIDRKAFILDIIADLKDFDAAYEAYEASGCPAELDELHMWEEDLEDQVAKLGFASVDRFRKVYLP